MKKGVLYSIMLLLLVVVLSGFTQEQFYREVDKIVDGERVKPATEYSDSELEKIMELLPKRFSDISGTEWYKKDLALMVAKGIINGSGSKGDIFAGSRETTRAEFWTMLGRLKGIDNKLDSGSKAKMTEILQGSTMENRITDSWYISYYYHINDIPFGLYSDRDMNKPIYRGEVATLIYKYLAEIESTEGIILSMADKRYFVDLPSKTIPIHKSQHNTELHKEQEQELGLSLPYYYPNFDKVVSGEKDMLRDTVVAINWNNYSGIICGLPDGSFGWNKPLTRAEAVAILARAFRIENRLPADKRKGEL